MGNALAFCAAWLSIRSQKGTLLLRIEDVDRGRARDEIADSQRRDLAWLGLNWDRETPQQSKRSYGPWLDALAPHTYQCVCSRKALKLVQGRCTCPSVRPESGATRFQLNASAVAFADRRWGPQLQAPNQQPDPTLRRRDGVYAYNLAVVADDIADGVTEVVRGADLLAFTGVQIQIWQAFGATPPAWLHAPLVLDAQGRKISKSTGGIGIRALREAGWTPTQVWCALLPWLGLPPTSLTDALAQFNPKAGPLGPIQLMTPPSRPGEPLDWRDTDVSEPDIER